MEKLSGDCLLWGRTEMIKKWHYRSRFPKSNGMIRSQMDRAQVTTLVMRGKRLLAMEYNGDD